MPKNVHKWFDLPKPGKAKPVEIDGVMYNVFRHPEKPNTLLITSEDDQGKGKNCTHEIEIE